MPVTVYTMRVEQGSDQSFPFYFFGPDPTGNSNPAYAVPINLAGCGVRLQVRESQDAASNLLLSLSTTGGGIVLATGTVTPGPALPSNPNGLIATITKAQSLALAAGTFYYDAFIDFLDGTSGLYLAGPFIVFPTVTR